MQSRTYYLLQPATCNTFSLSHSKLQLNIQVQSYVIDCYKLGTCSLVSMGYTIITMIYLSSLLCMKYHCGGGCGSPGGLSVGAVSNSFAEQVSSSSPPSSLCCVLRVGSGQSSSIQISLLTVNSISVLVLNFNCVNFTTSFFCRPILLSNSIITFNAYVVSTVLSSIPLPETYLVGSGGPDTETCPNVSHAFLRSSKATKECSASMFGFIMSDVQLVIRNFWRVFFKP